MKVINVVGARPNFMKIAPLIREMREKGGEIEWQLVHTGQHYDYDMSKAFFDDFDMPAPDYFLNAGSGDHAGQTAKIMMEFEKVCVERCPDIVIVAGDVNSTLACSITAKKLNIEVAHIEAGLRSRDMSMPEEINRMVTDAISDYLFVTEKSGTDNLKREGKELEKMFFVGNIMIDTLYYGLEKLKRSGIDHSKDLKTKKAPDRRYAVVTLHRPSNVDDEEKLKEILEALVEISRDMRLFFPMHPRTKKNIEGFNLGYLIKNTGIEIMPPLSYMEFLAVWKDASLVLTDSGGIQEETTAIGVPCFTIRDNTERPVTVEEGTNILVGTTKKGILKAYKSFKKGVRKNGKIPELWDGNTAARIIKHLQAA